MLIPTMIAAFASLAPAPTDPAPEPEPHVHQVRWIPQPSPLPPMRVEWCCQGFTKHRSVWGEVMLPTP